MKTRLNRWRERLSRAANRGYFTDHDENLASGWNTCAVGEGLATGSEEAPEDVQLAELGSSFYDEGVAKGNMASAWMYLRKIESRLVQLKKKAN